jgi:DNA-binding NtrC family response regulator
MDAVIKILILEDTPSDLELLLRELKKTGLAFTAHAVNRREEFEQALTDYQADLILSDFALPSFDGLSAFRLTRDRQIDVPFIVVSGSIGEERAVELIKSGVTDYALKDRMFTLHQKIVRAMDDYRKLKANKVADEKIRQQNAKLLEIAQFQSHIVRTPICQIQGLFSLIDFDNFSNPENASVIVHLHEIAMSMDNMVRKIVNMTDEVEHMADGAWA